MNNQRAYEYVKEQNFNHSPRTNFIFCEESAGRIKIRTNLFKLGSYTHDPNTGWLSSQLLALYALGFTGKVEIVEHNLSEKLAQKCFLRPNKLGKLCAMVAEKFELEVKDVGEIRHKDLYASTYWQHSATGEKNGSILLELELSLLGYQTVFTNHAGCEKSDVLTESGEYVKTLNSPDFGLPDIVCIDPTGSLIIIEAETTKNYKNGIKQINQEKFKKAADWFLSHYPSAPDARIYLSTFGLTPKNNEYIIGHTSKEGTTTLYCDTKPAYKRNIN